MYGDALGPAWAVVIEIVGAALCAFAHPTALRPVARSSDNGEGDSLAVRTVIAAKLGALRVSQNLKLWIVIFARVSR